MTERTMVLAALGMAGIAAGALVLLFLARKRRRKPLSLCPGSARGLRLLFPHHWLLRRACFYDLTGLVQDNDGCVRCPECGRKIRPDKALRSDRRWRPMPTLSLAGLAIVAALNSPFFRSGTWIKYLPDTALVAMERVGRPMQRPAMRSELRDRVWNGKISGRDAAWLARKLTADLRDDDRRFNAYWAMRLLPYLGLDAVTALERALSSDDYQQRQMAASVLRGVAGHNPTDQLLRVTVEGLRDDQLPFDPRANGDTRFNYVFNASEGTRYLAATGHIAAPFLVEGLTSQDAQQRFLCALASGFGKCDELLPMAAPILIEHLADNRFIGDATWAAPALFHFGPAVIPYLERFRDSRDEQQRDLVQLILLELAGPATTEAERHRRRALNTVTMRHANPIEQDISRFRLSRGGWEQ